MPHKMEPLTFLCESTAIKRRDATATISGMTFAQPAPPKRLKEARVTPVEELGTTTPESCKPKNAINKPMPAGIAALTAAGIASNIILRSPVAVKITKSTPSKRTNTSAFA